MKKSILKIVLAGMVLISLESVAMNVQIFTDNAHPVTVGPHPRHVHVDYYNLDALQTIVNQFNTAIKGQRPGVAEQQAKLLMQRYKPQLNQVVDGIKYVHQYGIKQIPTFVFDDGTYETQGQTDLQTAILDYQLWEKHAK